MKILTKLSVLIILSVITLTYSCKKEESEPTPQDYLTAGQWKMTGIMVDPPIDVLGVQISDVWDYVPACQKDNLVTFQSDGTIIEDEGDSKCLPDDPQTTTDGTWSLTTDGKTLIINLPDQDTQLVTITTLNETTLIGETVYDIEFQIYQYEVSATVTFTLQ